MNKRPKGLSKYLGVYKMNTTRINHGGIIVEKSYYRASIKTAGKTQSLGNFPFIPCGEILAALAYDAAAEKYHGEFANLNFKLIS